MPAAGVVTAAAGEQALCGGAFGDHCLVAVRGQEHGVRCHRDPGVVGGRVAGERSRRRAVRRSPALISHVVSLHLTALVCQA